MVNGDGTVFVERDGEITRLDARLSQTNLLMAAKALARHLNDDVSDTQPILDARLDDGSRVAAVLEPVSLQRHHLHDPEVRGAEVHARGPRRPRLHHAGERRAS